MKLRVFMANIGLRRPLFPLATPPMGLLYLAAYLRQRFDLELRIVNQRLENTPDDALARQASEFEPDLVFLSSLTTFAKTLCNVSACLRRRLPHVMQILGGPHVSATGSASLAGTVADAALQGEGEQAAEMLLQTWRDRAGFAAIPGLIWRNGENEIVVNPGSAPMIEDLDSLPMPAYDLIDLPAYWRHQSIAPLVGRRYASLVSSRGCPYSCMWCHDIFGKKIRVHSAARIVDEVEFLQKQYGIDDFEFLDDNFNFDRRRVLEFADLLHARNLKTRLAFPTALRGDLVTQEVADALRDAGAYLCGFSLETGSPRLQSLMLKRMDIPKFLRAVEMVAGKRIYVTGFCMMGFPTETEEELQQTIDVACESKFHTASFFTVTPYPGTPLFEYAKIHKPEKLVNASFENLDLSAMKINLTDLPDEVLYAYQRKAMRKFFLDPRRIARLLYAYPKPLTLPRYLPIFLNRTLKGLGGG